MVKHKAVLPDELIEQEVILQNQRRQSCITAFSNLMNELSLIPEKQKNLDRVKHLAKLTHLKIIFNEQKKVMDILPLDGPVLRRNARKRDKKIVYDPKKLPKLDKSKQYSASSIISEAMKVFACDPRVVSIDADLASTSGLEQGIGYVDRGRAFNVGVAEANMMCIGEAFAALGYNAWISTFCPFFDWKVLRRIAIGYQERIETIKKGDGWLSEGHGIDLTFLATAPNFETKTNGATHMGNDDILIFDEIAHLKIIDVSCPNQLMGIMKWIMGGNKGMVYLRIMRSPSQIIYDSDFVFEYGKGYKLRKNQDNQVVIVSSGRGVHEALTVAIQLDGFGINTGVIDMPSIDEKMLLSLYDAEKTIFVIEQNNGYIWSNFRQLLFRSRQEIETSRIVPMNTLDENEKPMFIHSATYDQLLDRFGLSPEKIVKTVRQKI